jgi:hypothetical protein
MIEQKYCVFKNDEVVKVLEYENIYEAGDNYVAWVNGRWSGGGQCCIINAYGEKLSYIYNNIHYNSSNKTYIAHQNHQYYLIDEYGNCYTKGYESISLDKGTNTFIVKEANGKWGVIDVSGKSIISCDYDNIEVIDNYFMCKLKRKWSVINSKGQIVQDNKYFGIYSYTSGHNLFTQTKKIGVFDESFNEICVKKWSDESDKERVVNELISNYKELKFNFERTQKLKNLIQKSK